MDELPDLSRAAPGRRAVLGSEAAPGRTGTASENPQVPRKRDQGAPTVSVERSVVPEPPHRPTKLVLIIGATLLCIAVLIIGGLAGASAGVLASAAGVWGATCTLLAAWRP